MVVLPPVCRRLRAQVLHDKALLYKRPKVLHYKSPKQPHNVTTIVWLMENRVPLGAANAEHLSANLPAALVWAQATLDMGNTVCVRSGGLSRAGF